MRKFEKSAIIISLAMSILFVAFFSYFIFTTIVTYKYPLKYKPEIISASNEFNIKPEIIASIINAESRFNKNAKSYKGALGLMQILPVTGQWIANELNVGNYEEQMLFDEKINIRFGTYYFGYLSNKFGNQNVALASYNAGEGVVRGWLNNTNYSVDKVSLVDIPYSETKHYIDKVNNNIKYYIKKF